MWIRYTIRPESSGFPCPAAYLNRSQAPTFVYYDRGGPVLLPDGRVLMGTNSGGKERLIVTAPGKGFVPFLETDQETSTPGAVLGEREVAVLEGAGSNRRIAIVSIPDDRIVRWVERPPGVLTAMAASLDGATVYCVASRVVWAIPAKEGDQKIRRKIRDGDGVAVDPRNGDLIVQIFGKDAVQLLRLPAQGGPEQPISYSGGSFFAYPIPLSPNAVGRDGRRMERSSASEFRTTQVCGDSVG